ncbi:MAG: EAL domain-containing protein [Variibacter sp.]|nr:EAL domain-containing protein [Variibacter sp.]
MDGLPFPCRPRRGTVAPIWLVVGLAIVCIALAVVSSAHRADLVALEREQTLISHALADRQNRLLREAEYIAAADEALQRLWLEPDADWIHQQIGMRLQGPLSGALVLVVDPASGRVRRLAGDAALPADQIAAALREIASLLAPITPEASSSPPLTMRGTLHEPPPARSAARMQRFAGEPAFVAAAALNADGRGDVRSSPILVIVKLISSGFLREVGEQLELPDLRLVDETATDPASNFFAPKNQAGETIARFAWTPNRPGAAIIWDTLPFVGIALGFFVALAGFVLRYARRTTATIAAGEDRLRYMAMHDPLSGLPNRMLFGERLDALIGDVRQGHATAALLSIDLDHFKDVNDTLGHHVGDALIGAVAQRLRGAVRGEDLVARLGGDEFAVLTRGPTDQRHLQEIAERIIAVVSAPYAVAGHTLVIGASIGIVVVDRDSRDSADIMRFADMALYRAKNEGRNRACIYDAAMNADLTQRKQLERDLRSAIERNGLAIAYQPQLSPDGERIIGVEALCRWPDPVRGLVPPSTFIAVAEQSELIIPLGEWVLRRACMDGRIWPDVTVAVNVSPLQFRRPDFVEVVQRILEQTGFDPRRLELELTESTLLGNVEGAESAMRRLKTLGVKFALDDFGTGYSSLLYLRTFPFDKLKIDRSFVNNIESAADAAAIVHAIISLGRGLGMKVTAEGVENANQQLFLRAAGVHAMQGYLFGHPVEATEIARRLATQAPATEPERQRRLVAG